MPTKNPRLNVVLEPSVYSILKRIAGHEGVSLSLKARDLIREALEDYEDAYWTNEAEKRERSFDAKKTLTHKAVWKN